MSIIAESHIEEAALAWLSASASLSPEASTSAQMAPHPNGPAMAMWCLTGG